MALRNKFLSPACAPDLKDTDPYFCFENIFRSDIRICVTATSFGGFSGATGNLKKHLRIHFFQKKLACSLVSNLTWFARAGSKVESAFEYFELEN